MRKKIISTPLFVLLTFVILLTGCNKPTEATPEMDVTQAYQTVEAKLTQSVAQTPAVTPTNTPEEIEPTQTPTLEEFSPTPTHTPGEPTNTATPETRCNQAAAAYPKIDITIDDDTEMPPGEEFTKIWRVVNMGTCTWNNTYTVVYFSGEQFGAPVSLPINGTVQPNGSLDISIDMTAPEATGTYQSNWKLRSPEGELFGIGPDGQSPFWVRIKVVAAPTATPTLTPSPTPQIQASGSVTLVLTDTLDLDNLQVNVGGADLVFQVTADNPPQHQLAPLGGATIAVFGGSQPSLGSCQAAELAAIPISVDGLASGTYLCYKTGSGLTGRARITAFSASNGTISLEIYTWK